MSRTIPRDLHPVAWWVWALGLAAAASATTNPLVMALLIGSAAVVVTHRRSDQPWGASFRLYLGLGVAIVVIRVLFRIIFGGGDETGQTVLLQLPEVPLPDWVAGIRLFGAVTLESVLAGLYDGLRLATIVICIGAANSLANPKRLLKSVPPALYEIGTALVVSVTLLPQLADSIRRVRRAQTLRGGATDKIGRLRRLLVPVLEDAFERSMRMAAGMDTRGYGRSGGQDRRQRTVTGSLMLTGLCGVCVGVYAILDKTAPRWLALPMLTLGVIVAVLGISSAGRRVQRTRYRPDTWQLPEFTVMLSGLAVAVILWWVADNQALVAYPPLDQMPVLSTTALVAGLLAGLPALLAPRPVLTEGVTR